MLTYTLQTNDKKPLYEQIYSYIKQDILNGVLKKDEKLPSKRTFAENHGISVITVENAYNQLLAEGYLYSLPKKGFYVADIYEFSIYPAKKKKTYQKGALTRSIISSDEKTKKEYFADFTANYTSDSIFPFSIWSKLLREQLTYNQKELLSNAPYNGVLPLREAISLHLSDYHGMNVDPEQIVIGAGTEYLYGLLVQLLGTKKKYAIENPGYQKIQKIYNSLGVNCTPISMDSMGILPKELEEKKIQIVHISPSHHFPTGIVMPIGRRIEILQWANQASDRYIIEDDYDSEFRFRGQPIPPMQSVDANNKVIYMNTFNKTLTSTIRISYMVLPPALTQKYQEHLSFYSCPVATMEQYVLANFISQGYFEKHLNRMRTYYHNKRDILLKAIKESPLSEKVRISEEDSGLHFLMQIKTEKTEEELQTALKKADIKMSALSEYDQSPKDYLKHTYVINYSSIEEDRIDETIRRLLLAIG